MICAASDYHVTIAAHKNVLVIILLFYQIYEPYNILKQY